MHRHQEPGGGIDGPQRQEAEGRRCVENDDVIIVFHLAQSETQPASSAPASWSSLAGGCGGTRWPLTWRRCTLLRWRARRLHSRRSRQRQEERPRPSRKSRQGRVTKQQVKQLKKDYQQLRSLAIQKVGVNNYSFNQAKVIHQNLYPELSLNSGPLNYRDPFAQKVLENK